METLHLSLTLKHLATGIVTSPDYPANYPSGLAKPTTIQVEPGRVIRLQFTAFHTANCNDHLAIMDGDGTTLMEKACGASLPTNITSASNTINMLFKTDGSGSTEGWSVSWVAVTPGESTMSREDDVCCLWFYVDKRSIIVITSSDFCFIQKKRKIVMTFLLSLTLIVRLTDSTNLIRVQPCFPWQSMYQPGSRRLQV